MLLRKNEDIEGITFHYGDSFDTGIFPTIPEREDCFAWDRNDLGNLCFDVDINVVYSRYITVPKNEG